MNIYDSGYVRDNTRNRFAAEAEREVFLGSFLSLGSRVLERYFRSASVIPVFRVFVLDDDENIVKDISPDVVSASLSVTYQSGQRRTLSLTLANASGRWAYGVNKTLWHGQRFRLDCGAVIDGVLYWQRQGVFLLSEPSFSSGGSENTITLSLCDKWGLWDGTVYGNTQLRTVIPQGIPMRQAFDIILHEDNGTWQMWDCRPCLFNNEQWDRNTYYTIKQDAGSQKSENLLNMAQTISSDVYYDNFGRCVVESNISEFIGGDVPVVWTFTENGRDCSSPVLKYNRGKYCNKIITKGNIVNGYQFSASVENRNRMSPFNVIDSPVTPKVNNNTHLYSDNLCLEQSMKEMIDQSRGLLSVSLTAGYLPFLDVNLGVRLMFPSLGIENKMYIIDSISYSIGTACTMTLGLTSFEEVVF